MKQVKLGLKENWKQFVLLVIINAFVGGMIGLERSILPRIAELEFHIAAKTAILSFIVVFGISKAISNYFTGVWANRTGRKSLLTIGWIIAMPVPFILMSYKITNLKLMDIFRNNGSGIPQKIVDKIFQPFFTTKPTGQGTGLGLSLSYDIIKAHGGEINVETKDNNGACFVITLPVKNNLLS